MTCSVHPAYQRQGVGSRMLALMREELKKEPVPILYLCLNTERGFPCVDFYRRTGFECDSRSILMAADVNRPSITESVPAAAP